MSNEELVVAIKQGEQGRTLELWQQVAGLVRWKANQIVTALQLRGNPCGVELDDLIQSGYLAMVAAVDSYSPEKGAFSTWLMYHLQTKFATLTGYRTEKQQSEPLNRAASLDKPIDTDDGGGTELGDLIPDNKAATLLETVEETVYNQQLHEALEAALGELPSEQADILRRRYWDDMTLSAIGEDKGKSHSQIRQIEMKAIQELRKPHCSRYLKGFAEFDPYRGGGLSAFRADGLSIEERYLILQEAAQQHKAVVKRW